MMNEYNNLREQIVRSARQRIGTPFKHQGRKAGIGLDCIGLVVDVFKEFYPDIVNLDMTNYSRIPNKNKLKETLDLLLQPVDLYEAYAGDIILFAYGKEPQHVGILTENSVIHAYASVGCVIETSILKDDIRIVATYSFLTLLPEQETIL
jgi:cell wall-associated NlpC family hydrolase